MNYNLITNVFDEYVKNYHKNKNIKLKYNHSYRVAEISEIIATKLKLSKEDILLAKIIGLLHDIGRFEQIKKYNTFNDKNFDHAEYGIKILFEENLIEKFIQNREYDNIIYNAIKYHNKISLPNNLDNKVETFCKIIRDADKIDILKVLTDEFDLNFNEQISNDVLNNFFNEKPIKYSDINNLPDKIIIYCAYIFDINYIESIEVLKQTNNLLKFINSINVSENNKEIFEKIKYKINEKMEVK